MPSPISDYATADPERMLVTDGIVTLTRRQFDERCNRLARLLASRGVGDGDAVAIMSGNCVDFVVGLVGLGLAGISQVPVNWHFSAEEASYLLQKSGAKAFIFDAARAEVARQAAESSGIPVDLCLEIGPALDAVLASASAAPLDPQPLIANPIYFTSGTTGRPKSTRMAEVGQGVAVADFVAQANQNGFVEDSRVLIPGPLYHGGPLMQSIRTMVSGGQLWVMPRFDPEEFLGLIEQHRIARVLTVPTHLVRLFQLPEETKRRYDLSCLEEISHIGAMMAPEVKRSLIGWMGPVFVDAYGCTELGMVSRISSQEWLTRPGSVGVAMNGFRIHILDEETGEELGPDQIGSIYFSSEKGSDIVYLDDPEKTAACHRGTMYTIGDIGYLDGEGYLFLVDRRVDLIISGGANIYPAEIEAAMIMHPAIADVGVFGIPDSEWGHQVKAAVQLKPGFEAGPAMEQEIIGWTRQQLAHFKVPKSIDFHVELPRFTNGKLHRRALRAPYWEQREAEVAR